MPTDTQMLDWLAVVDLNVLEDLYWESDGDNGITRVAIAARMEKCAALKRLAAATPPEPGGDSDG